MKRKSPKSKPAAPYTGKEFAVGTCVLINRPSPIWSGCVGSVVGFNNGLHRIKIKSRNGVEYPAPFHADVSGEMLEEWI